MSNEDKKIGTKNKSSSKLKSLDSLAIFDLLDEEYKISAIKMAEYLKNLQNIKKHNFPINSKSCVFIFY